MRESFSTEVSGELTRTGRDTLLDTSSTPDSTVPQAGGGSRTPTTGRRRKFLAERKRLTLERDTGNADIDAGAERCILEARVSVHDLSNGNDCTRYGVETGVATCRPAPVLSQASSSVPTFKMAAEWSSSERFPGKILISLFLVFAVEAVGHVDPNGESIDEDKPAVLHLDTVASVEADTETTERRVERAEL